VRNSVAHVKGLLTADPIRVQSLCRIYVRADLHLLGRLKAALLVGIRAFEQHEADVVERAGTALVEAIGATLPEIGNYYRRLAADTHNHGITPDLLPAELVEAPIPPDPGLPGHGGPPL
jgi:sulfite reductase (NADPH) flavoprotein alpha-component